MTNSYESGWRRFFSRSHKSDVNQSAGSAAIDPIDAEVSWDEAYEVVIYDDSETPMEFVVELLERHFLILQKEAVEFTLKVHTNGHIGIGRLTQQTAEDVKNSMLTHISKQSVPLRVEVSRWAASRAKAD